MPAKPDAEGILDFWFGGDVSSPQAVGPAQKRWFRPDAAFDAEVTRDYGTMPERVAAGEFDAWMQRPRSAVARILCVDQFPRNIFRGRAQAFAYDAVAQAATFDALERGVVDELHPLHAAFLLMPLQHAEDPDVQQRSTEEFERLARHAPKAWRRMMESFAEYARRHAEVVIGFGRFPHRNERLGRESTPEELEYLEAGGENFG